MLQKEGMRTLLFHCVKYYIHIGELLLKTNNDDTSPISHQQNVELRTTGVCLLATLLLLLKIKYKEKIQKICYYAINLVNNFR